jgi:SanA protein
MKLRKIIKALFFIFAAAIAGIVMINIGMILAARKYVYTDINVIPPRTAVLVLGSLTYGTRLSPVLHDRVVGGIMLIENNKGEKILLTGDHGQRRYDEVNAMRLFVLENAPGIPEENVFMDHAGFNTWDSMYRARDVFEVKDLIIVTQEFHISRALCMARSLGLDAVGYSLSEDRFAKASIRVWRSREYLARVKAFFSIVVKPKPRYLGEKIPITGDGRATWD